MVEESVELLVILVVGTEVDDVGESVVGKWACCGQVVTGQRVHEG